MNDIYYIQNEKQAFIKALTEFQEIKNPTFYHKLAYQYVLDGFIDKGTTVISRLIAMQQTISKEIEKQGLGMKEPPPQIILDRMDEIINAYLTDNPNTSDAERQNLIGKIFEEEFDGLYDENEKIDKKWLANYLSDKKNLPAEITIPLTPEMITDVDTINTSNLSDDDKEASINALFEENGKYEGYVKEDGSVDESVLFKETEQDLTSSELAEAKSL